MTPKEKAKQLLNVHLDVTKRSLSVEGWFYDVDIAKQCALIAVDEILEILYKIVKVTASSYVIDQIEHYLEVKQEIEKL